MKWALFFMGEYVHLFVGGAFFTTLFLGGWSLNPFGHGPDLPLGGSIGMILLQFGIVLGKTFLIICLTMMVRWTLPRFRFDQLMKVGWKVLLPMGIGVLMLTGIVGLRTEIWQFVQRLVHI